MQSVVNGLKEKYGTQIKFGDLDFYDKQNAGLVQQFKILGHPGFVLLDGQGKLLQRWIGVIPADTMENGLKTALVE